MTFSSTELDIILLFPLLGLIGILVALRIRAGELTSQTQLKRMQAASAPRGARSLRPHEYTPLLAATREEFINPRHLHPRAQDPRYSAQAIEDGPIAGWGMHGPAHPQRPAHHEGVFHRDVAPYHSHPGHGSAAGQPERKTGR